MSRKRSSKISRAIRAAEYEQNRIRRREANAQQRRAAIQPQAIPPQAVQPQVRQPQVVQPQVIQPQPLEERIRQLVGIFDAVQNLRRGILPQLLPPVRILARQTTGIHQIPIVIQPVPLRENEDVLQFPYEEGEASSSITIVVLKLPGC